MQEENDELGLLRNERDKKIYAAEEEEKEEKGRREGGEVKGMEISVKNGRRSGEGKKVERKKERRKRIRKGTRRREMWQK